MTVPKRLPTAEELREEMGRDIADDDLPLNRLARRKLLAGQAIRPSEFAERYACTTGVVNFAVESLRLAGYTIAADTEEDPRYAGHGRRTRRVFRLVKVPTDQPGQVAPADAVTPPAQDAPMDAPRTTKARKSRKATKAAKARRAKPPATVEAAPPPTETVSLNGHAPGLDIARLPHLFQQVSVFALAANDDHTITIGLQSEDTKWLLTLTGQHER